MDWRAPKAFNSRANYLFTKILSKMKLINQFFVSISLRIPFKMTKCFGWLTSSFNSPSHNNQKEIYKWDILFVKTTTQNNNIKTSYSIVFLKRIFVFFLFVFKCFFIGYVSYEKKNPTVLHDRKWKCKNQISKNLFQ